MFKAARIALLAVVFVSVAGAVVMWLWNALVPDIFGASEITWVQALGLLVLTRLLVGGRGLGGPGGRRRWRGHRERKLANMSPEERERWKAERARYCDGGAEQQAAR
jgi:hypothetical protein